MSAAAFSLSHGGNDAQKTMGIITVLLFSQGYLGAVSRPGSVRWGVAARIIWAWIFTIPASALIAVVTYYAVRALGL